MALALAIVPLETAPPGDGLFIAATAPRNAASNTPCLHRSYVSLFPLMLRLLPANDPQLGRDIRALLDPDSLYSVSGVRSLSRQSSLYNRYNSEHDKPYWRGPVWININYLLIKALRHYARTPGPHQQQAAYAGHKLRETVLRTVVESYRGTGYFWEQYNDTTAAGQGAHPFTGWTSLVALIAGEG